MRRKSECKKSGLSYGLDDSQRTLKANSERMSASANSGGSKEARSHALSKQSSRKLTAIT